MMVQLHFNYEIDEGTVAEWREEGQDVTTSAILLSADLLADWILDGGVPEEGVNATIIMEDD